MTSCMRTDLVVTGPAGALDALVAEEVEVALSGMVDALVHHGASQSVPVAVLVVVCGEESTEKYKIEIRRFSPADWLYLVW